MNLRRTVKSSYKTLKEYAASGKSDWLSDNFHTVDLHYKALMKNKKIFKLGNLYEKLKRYCAENGYIFDSEKIVEYINADGNGRSLEEARSVAPLIAVCAVNAAADAVNFGNEAEIPLYIKLLVFLRGNDMQKLVPKIWEAEEELARLDEGYGISDTATKNAYRTLLAEKAKKRRKSEKDTLEKLYAEAKSSGVCIGSLLFDPPKSNARFFISATVFTFFVLFAISVYFTGFMSITVAVPVAAAALSLADIISGMLMKTPVTPKIREDLIPNDAKTLITVSSLLTGGKDDLKLYKKLADFAYSNPEKYIYFCLLADLTDCDKPTLPRDAEIFETARAKISELNETLGERFCLFFRERRFNESEGKFGGYERKRGAVCELAEHIASGASQCIYGGASFIRDIKYIITLDADTQLSVGSASELLAAALHPVNTPITENGKVTQGFGIIQPEIKTELSSAYKTHFSRLMTGAGGGDPYAGAVYSRMQTVFGHGTFCGKGIIDVKLFRELICGKLPEKKILSHDVIEGSILRTRAATDIILTDSIPKGACSYYRRQHRWIRGDVQNLLFLKGDILNPASKAMLVLTVLRHLLPVFSVISIVLGSFIAPKNALLFVAAAYSYILLPSAISVIRALFNGVPFAARRFFSKTNTLVFQTSARMLYSVTASCREAFLALNSVSLAAIRMKSGKKTLEWVTSAQAENISSGLGKYVMDGISSVLLGFILIFFAKNPFLKIIGLLWFIYPLVTVFLSGPINGGHETKAKLTEKQKKTLSAHVADMWRFYAENVGRETNHLPPDNIQISPVSAVAYRTSPTNIGFYLVSLIAARDSGLIDSEALYEKSENTVSVIERLEKKDGNLYNWYDIKTLDVIGEKYVSSVDDGNFTVMMCAFKEGLREYSGSDPRYGRLISRCENIVAQSDISRFYDEEKGLLTVGIRENGETESSYYDLLMSEARMTAYYATAKRITPKKLWENMGRTLTRSHGYIGMLSWSGTAFEYFMPQLFLPLYRDSFIFESLSFALAAQKRADTVWGRSESGYWSFDADMNYGYRANGIKELALRRLGKEENVVSPYSTYLSFCICDSDAFANLKALEKAGMYGKYGMYEAIDFDRAESGVCVKSYMAHHVGMSLIACMNALYDGIFIKRTMRDGALKSASGLLQEKIPVEAHTFSGAESEDDAFRSRSKPIRKKNESCGENSLAVLSRGAFCACITDEGKIGLKYGDEALLRVVYEKNSPVTPKITFSRGGRDYCCTPGSYIPSAGQTPKYSFEKGSAFASHIVSGKDFSGRVRYELAKQGASLIIGTRAEALKKYDITLSFEPVLAKNTDFHSHVSFSRLFIESEYDAASRIIYFHRRERETGKRIKTLAAALTDPKGDISFTTSAANSEYGSDPNLLHTDGYTGSPITPFCIIKTRQAEGGKAEFIITYGESKEECRRNILLARRYGGKGDSANISENASRLLYLLLYGKGGGKVKRLISMPQDILWSKGISGDEDIISARVSESDKNAAKALISAHAELKRAFFRFDLIFFVSETDGYNRKTETSLKKYLREHEPDNALRGGSVFFIREKVGDSAAEAIKNFSAVYFELSCGKAEALLRIDTLYNAKRFPERANILCTEKIGNGCFTDKTYIADNTEKSFLPYGFTLSGCRFSSFVTQSSLGYTFFDNAHEHKLCSFDGDIIGKSGESIIMICGDQKYDLCACAASTEFGNGKAVYRGSCAGTEYALTVFVSPKYPVKLIKLEADSEVKTSFVFDPVMGDGIKSRGCIYSDRIYKSTAYKEFVLPISAWSGHGFAGVFGGYCDEGFSLSSKGKDAYYFIGAAATDIGVAEIVKRINEAFFDNEEYEAEVFAKSAIPKDPIPARTEAENTFFNVFLPQQIYFCRFLARASYFQSGGAYGFRDQLQDCLAMLYFRKNAVKTHILRCCAHQYEEGSVMHWWHGCLNKGVKTNCSDDMLWLPLAVSEYVKATGDTSILDIKIPYIRSEKLSFGEERYEKAEEGERASVYSHCLRAFKRGDRRGKHGLILLGSCDWNDGFSKAGEKGIGESVFTTLLYAYAAEKFASIALFKQDKAAAESLTSSASELKNAVEAECWYGDRYARAFTDEGDVLGVGGRKECEIDILPQAFAALCGLDPSRVKTALETAYSLLYESQSGTFRLFVPPFSGGNENIGYIRGYGEYMRENGGQYSHGALFGVLGFLKAGMKKEARSVLESVIPISRFSDPRLARRYGGEPYAVAADIYGGEHGGRAGWTHYTGSAAWLFKILHENPDIFSEP